MQNDKSMIARHTVDGEKGGTMSVFDFIKIITMLYGHEFHENSII